MSNVIAGSEGEASTKAMQTAAASVTPVKPLVAYNDLNLDLLEEFMVPACQSSSSRAPSSAEQFSLSASNPFDAFQSIEGALTPVPSIPESHPLDFHKESNTCLASSAPQHDHVVQPKTSSSTSEADPTAIPSQPSQGTPSKIADSSGSTSYPTASFHRMTRDVQTNSPSAPTPVTDYQHALPDRASQSNSSNSIHTPMRDCLTRDRGQDVHVTQSVIADVAPHHDPYPSAASASYADPEPSLECAPSYPPFGAAPCHHDTIATFCEGWDSSHASDPPLFPVPKPALVSSSAHAANQAQGVPMAPVPQSAQEPSASHATFQAQGVPAVPDTVPAPQVGRRSSYALTNLPPEKIYPTAKLPYSPPEKPSSTAPAARMAATAGTASVPAGAAGSHWTSAAASSVPAGAAGEAAGTGSNTTRYGPLHRNAPTNQPAPAQFNRHVRKPSWPSAQYPGAPPAVATSSKTAAQQGYAGGIPQGAAAVAGMLKGFGNRAVKAAKGGVEKLNTAIAQANAPNSPQSRGLASTPTPLAGGLNGLHHRKDAMPGSMAPPWDFCSVNAKGLRRTDSGNESRGEPQQAYTAGPHHQKAPTGAMQQAYSAGLCDQQAPTGATQQAYSAGPYGQQAPTGATQQACSAGSYDQPEPTGGAAGDNGGHKAYTVAQNVMELPPKMWSEALETLPMPLRMEVADIIWGDVDGTADPPQQQYRYGDPLQQQYTHGDPSQQQYTYGDPFQQQYTHGGTSQQQYTQGYASWGSDAQYAACAKAYLAPSFPGSPPLGGPGFQGHMPAGHCSQPGVYQEGDAPTAAPCPPEAHDQASHEGGSAYEGIALTQPGGPSAHTQAPECAAAWSRGDTVDGRGPRSASQRWQQQQHKHYQHENCQQEQQEQQQQDELNIVNVANVDQMSTWDAREDAPECAFGEQADGAQLSEARSRSSSSPCKHSANTPALVEARMKAATAGIASREQEARRRQEALEDMRKAVRPKVAEWENKYRGNIRSLLATLQTVLWEESGWKTVTVSELLDSSQIKRVYMRSNLLLHPDKVNQNNGSVDKVAIAGLVFDVLKDAWNIFQQGHRLK